MAANMFLFLVFVSAFSGIQLQTIPPRNAAGLNSQPLELNCTLDQRGLQWHYLDMNGSPSLPIYQAGNVMTDDYEKGSREHNIIIKSLSYNTAGEYQCSTNDGLPGRQMNIQVAAASALQCAEGSGGPKTEGDTPELICLTEVSAKPSLEPHFQWYRNGEPVEGWIKPPESSPTPGAPEELRFSYNFTVTHQDHQAIFECRLSFRYAADPSNNRDDTDPDFVEICQTSFDVQFAPTDVYIHPSSHNVPIGYREPIVGNIFNCTARAYPEADFSWQSLNDDDYVEGSLLEVVDGMVGAGELVYNCTAENRIDGQRLASTDQVKFFARARSDAGTISSNIVSWIMLATAILTYVNH